LNIKFATQYDLRNSNQVPLDGKCSPISVVANKYYQTITINSDILTGVGEKSNILIAKTIIHEFIHAYINIKYLNITFGASLSLLSDETLEEMMHRAFTPFNPLGLGNSHHNFMFNQMIPLFEDILCEIVNDLLSVQNLDNLNNATIIDTNGEVIEDFDFMHFYKYIAFQGLNNSESYINDIANNSIELKKYEAYNQFGRGTSNDCQ
jgi:hypothetical protein